MRLLDHGRMGDAVTDLAMGRHDHRPCRGQVDRPAVGLPWKQRVGTNISEVEA